MTKPACGSLRRTCRARWRFVPRSERRVGGHGLAAAGRKQSDIHSRRCAAGVTVETLPQCRQRWDEGAAVAAAREGHIKECDERGEVLRTLDRSRLW